MTPFEISILILASVTVVLLVILAGFIIKLFIDTDRLINNVNEVTILVKNGVEPTLKELKETLENVNSIAKQADKQVDAIKKAFSLVLGTGGLAVCGLKNISGGFLKGIMSGFKLFRRK